MDKVGATASACPLGEVVALDRHGLNGLSGDMTQPSAILTRLWR